MPVLQQTRILCCSFFIIDIVCLVVSYCFSILNGLYQCDSALLIPVEAIKRKKNLTKFKKKKE